MAGPTASVLFRTAMTKRMASMVEAFVREVASDVVGDDFWVTNLTALGGQGTCDPRPFIVDRCVPSCPTMDPDDDDFQSLDTILGFVPQSRVSFAAMSNQSVDHEILGRLCSRLARFVNGIIDLHGRLDLAEPMDGLFQVPFPSVSGVTIYHYCTADFMDWWLAHERFRLIK